MFKRKLGLYRGSEYYDVLMSFIRTENESGKLSLKKARVINIAWISALLVDFITLITFAYLIHLFFQTASLSSLILMLLCALFIVILTTVLCIIPVGLQSKFDHIPEIFDDESLIRLYTHGAPDDVIDSILIAFNRNHSISYAELYDIFWMCSRQNAGADKACVMAERYDLVKARIRNVGTCKGLN